MTYILLATQEDSLHAGSPTLPTSILQQKLMFSQHVDWSHLNTLSCSIPQELLSQSLAFFVPCWKQNLFTVVFCSYQCKSGSSPLCLHRARSTYECSPRGPVLYPALGFQLESHPKEHLEAETTLKPLVPCPLFNLWMLMGALYHLKWTCYAILGYCLFSRGKKIELLVICMPLRMECM